MKFSNLIVALCCGIITACSTAPNLDFPHEETLTPELMPLQGITNPISVEIKHPYLIIRNLQLKDSIFHIYDIRSKEFKSAFGTTGQGPTEFILPTLVRSQLSNVVLEDNDVFHLFNINKQGEAILTKVKKPMYKKGTLHDVVLINDSLFVADPKYMLLPSLHLLHMKDSLPRKTWTYRNPNIRDYSLDPNMGNAYANGNRIVFCYGYKKQIDFMDTEFNLIKSVKFEFNSTEPTADNQGDRNNSYVQSYLGKRYLYAIFFNTSWYEHRAQSTVGTYLEVFDLDGNPVARYHLNGRRPTGFVVDEETFTLYGAGEGGDPEGNLLMYKLNGLS